MENKVIKLAPRDKKRYESFVKILELCNEKPCTATDISIDNNVTLPTIRNHCAFLKYEGYLSTTKGMSAWNGQPTTFYSALKKEYCINSIVPITLKIKATMVANGTKTVRRIIPLEIIKKEEAPSHIRNIKERHVASTRKFESRGIGSSMGMV
jgi:hypothetical protein